MDKKQAYLNESLKHLQIAEHLTEVIFPLVNEKKLLLKILEQINKSVINSINAANKKIIFRKEINPENKKKIIKQLEKLNLKKEQIRKILEIMEINQKHKKSAMEFERNNKAVIMMNDLNTITLNIESIKEYLAIAKTFYIKVSSAFL